MNKKSVAIATLGCRLNQFESNSLLHSFQKSGYQIVSHKQHADVYVINTCTVTNKSDAKSRHLIRQLKRTNPHSLVFVTGCYAQTNPQQLLEIPEVDHVVGNDQKNNLLNIVNHSLNPHSLNPQSLNPQYPSQLPQFKNTPFLDTPITQYPTQAKTYLKIQDGCNENCSYCKIPKARGKAQSRPLHHILHNAQQLINSGYKELILTGINIGDYSFQSFQLHHLLQKLLNLKGNFRIHLSSIEPNKVHKNLLEFLQHPKLCSHLHLPLQSGNKRILKLMNRRYTPELYSDLVSSLLQKLPSINITTDLMVGFPSETHSDFLDSFSLIQKLKISHVHTFKYSQRENTTASSFKNQVPEDIKNQRSLSIRNLSQHLNLQYRKKFLKTNSRVLIEQSIANHFYTGYNHHYVRLQVYSKNHIPLGKFQTAFVNQVQNEKTSAIQTFCSNL